MERRYLLGTLRLILVKDRFCEREKEETYLLDDGRQEDDAEECLAVSTFVQDEGRTVLVGSGTRLPVIILLNRNRYPIILVLSGF